MSTAAVERRALRETMLVAPTLVLAGSVAYLLASVVPDVHGKPWHEDEAVAGLISAQPLGDVLHTVLLDRGGAPLHFVLAHLAFSLDGSPLTLRWLSLVFALGTIPLCYDLARRLAGQFAGLTAAALAATSQLLAVYATFGRMYSLFAFTAALALDLFVRAVDRPTRATLAAATAAALLPILVHPFGVFVFGAELAVALWLWRLRALPAALLAIPFVVPYLRLPGRYEPDVGMSAPEAALRALGGSAGGWSAAAAVFCVFAAIGAWTLPRRFAALGLLLIVAPPLLLAAFGDSLSPRHFVFMLPVWITFVATGVAQAPAVAPLVVVAAILAPSATADPRAAVPARANPPLQIRAGDALYPYAAPFLAALPQAAAASPLPREPFALRSALRGAHVLRTLVALPAGSSWKIVVVPGPFTNVPRALTRAVPHLHGIERAAALQLYATSTEGTSPQRSSSR